MASATGSRRRSRAAAAQERAAKDRRQKMLVAAPGVVLVALLAFQLPRLLKGSGSSSSSVAPTGITTAAVPTTPSVPPKSAAERAVLRNAPRDVFAKVGGGSPSTLGSVPTPPGLHDPFARASSPAAAVAPVSRPTPVRRSVLPGTIILGTPGTGKVAVQGWIVILASIPTAQGQGAATAFAGQAAKASIGKVSVLNSSNRRPLRGGYWVVYTGPFPSLGQVSTQVGHVHSAGFTGAYIRELIVYKKKSKK